MVREDEKEQRLGLIYMGRQIRIDSMGTDACLMGGRVMVGRRTFFNPQLSVKFWRRNVSEKAGEQPDPV